MLSPTLERESGLWFDCEASYINFKTYSAHNCDQRSGWWPARGLKSPSFIMKSLWLLMSSSQVPGVWGKYWFWTRTRKVKVQASDLPVNCKLTAKLSSRNGLCSPPKRLGFVCVESHHFHAMMLASISLRCSWQDGSERIRAWGFETSCEVVKANPVRRR